MRGVTGKYPASNNKKFSVPVFGVSIISVQEKETLVWTVIRLQAGIKCFKPL